jgi:hypothetical protein
MKKKKKKKKLGSSKFKPWTKVREGNASENVSPVIHDTDAKN